MNHYPFNPSDYMMATAHLEPLHDLCYRRCLDLYYDSEAPLTLDKRTLSKRLRVNEDVLSEVLAEFFFEDADGWHHARCDKEIARYQAKSEKAKFAGSLGGRAKNPNKQANAKRTLSERQANASNQNQNQNQNSTTAKAVGRIASRSLLLSDDEWIGELENDSTYQGLNIRQELGKMQRWCEANCQKPSRKRFVNWLNRAEKPIGVNGQHKPRHAAYDAATATEGMTADQILKF